MGDASYTEDDDRGRLVSIIHEALKKLEGARQGYTGVHAGSAVLVKQPQSKRTLALALVTLFVIVSAMLYMVWREKKPSVPAQDASRGQITQGEQSPEAAQQAARVIATEIQPQIWNEVKGIELFNLGRYSDAAAEFAEGVRIEPENSVRLNNLGIAYFRSGKIAEAEDAYKKALAINPDYPEALNNYGALFASRADYSRAIKEYRNAINFMPDYGEAYLNSAIASELSGEFRTAVRDYEKFLSIADPAKDAGVIAEVRKKLFELRPAIIIEDAKGARR